MKSNSKNSQPEVKNLYSEDNIFHYVELIKKWKIFVILNVSFITLVATIIAFLLPLWFTSTASIKPTNKTGISFFSAVLGSKGLAEIGKNLNIGGLQYSDLDFYISLLNSKRILLEMIKRFDLKNKYGKEYIFQTLNELISNSSFKPDPPSNTLIISTQANDPKTAKAMVETYINLLRENLNELDKIELTNNRKFIEKRYLQNQSDLANTELKLEEFGEKYGVIVPEEQFKATITAMAEIEAQKLFLETQLGPLLKQHGENAPSSRNLELQMQILQNRLNQLKGDSILISDFFLPLKLAPELISTYIRLYRDFEIQSKLMEYIYPLYEQVKMDEEKVPLPFVIIDKPDLPEYKTKPKKALIILSAFTVSMFFSLMYIYLVEYLRKQKRNKIG